jgi:hypothetical protein
MPYIDTTPKEVTQKELEKMCKEARVDTRKLLAQHLRARKSAEACGPSKIFRCKAFG